MEASNQEMASQPVVSRPKLTPVFILLETAIKIWWKNLKKIISIYLWGLLFAMIPLLIALAFFGLIIWLNANSALTLSLKIVAIIIGVAGVLLALYFSIRSYMGIFLLVKKDYQGKGLEIFKETKKLFWPYLGLALLTALFVLLWSFLLIIPGIIYSVFYCLAVYVFFFEGKKGMAALKQSKRLVKGYWWAVFGRYFFIGLIVWIFSILMAIPSMLSTENSFFFSFWNGVMQVVNFIIGPIVLFYSYQIYQDLVKIKK